MNMQTSTGIMLTFDRSPIWELMVCLQLEAEAVFIRNKSRELTNYSETLGVR